MASYASKQLYIQQVSIPLIAKNNVRKLPGQIRIISLALKLSKTSFVHAIQLLEKALHMLDQSI